MTSTIRSRICKKVSKKPISKSKALRLKTRDWCTILTKRSRCLRTITKKSRSKSKWSMSSDQLTKKKWMQDSSSRWLPVKKVYRRSLRHKFGKQIKARRDSILVGELSPLDTKSFHSRIYSNLNQRPVLEQKSVKMIIKLDCKTMSLNRKWAITKLKKIL